MTWKWVTAKIWDFFLIGAHHYLFKEFTIHWIGAKPLSMQISLLGFQIPDQMSISLSQIMNNLLLHSENKNLSFFWNFYLWFFGINWCPLIGHQDNVNLSCLYCQVLSTMAKIKDAAIITNCLFLGAEELKTEPWEGLKLKDRSLVTRTLMIDTMRFISI